MALVMVIEDEEALALLLKYNLERKVSTWCGNLRVTGHWRQWKNTARR